MELSREKAFEIAKSFRGPQTYDEVWDLMCEDMAESLGLTYCGTGQRRNDEKFRKTQFASTWKLREFLSYNKGLRLTYDDLQVGCDMGRSTISKVLKELEEDGDIFRLEGGGVVYIGN